MARAFKFFAAFFFTALIIFGAILFLNWKPFTTFYENREAMVEGSEWVEETYSLRGLSQYIAANPQHVSVVSSVISAAGDSTISYGADIQRPMGTTANIFILIASADAIESGIMDAGQPIDWNAVSTYQVPGVAASEHEQSRQAATNRGWINSEGEIPLSRALQLLAEFNDLALSDYLWWNIGRDGWNDLTDRLNLEQTQLPLPFSGLYQALSPGIRQMETAELYESERSKSETHFRTDVIERSARFAADPEYREHVLNFAESNRLGNTFMEERDGLEFFPKTTASEIVRLLTDLHNDELISEQVSTMVKEWLRWPLERQSGINRDFTDYGAIYDNRMGLLNGIDFGTSAYTGDTTVQAVFFDRIQIAFWFHMSSNHMHQDFQQRLIFDPAMILQMQQVMDGQVADITN